MGTLKPQSNTAMRLLVHWPLMGGLLHLVQRGGACVGCGPTQPLLAVAHVTTHPALTASVCTNFISFDVAL